MATDANPFQAVGRDLIEAMQALEQELPKWGSVLECDRRLEALRNALKAARSAFADLTEIMDERGGGAVLDEAREASDVLARLEGPLGRVESQAMPQALLRNLNASTMLRAGKVEGRAALVELVGRILSEFDRWEGELSLRVRKALSLAGDERGQDLTWLEASLEKTEPAFQAYESVRTSGSLGDVPAAEGVPRDPGALEGLVQAWLKAVANALRETERVVRERVLATLRLLGQDELLRLAGELAGQESQGFRELLRTLPRDERLASLRTLASDPETFAAVSENLDRAVDRAGHPPPPPPLPSVIVAPIWAALQPASSQKTDIEPRVFDLRPQTSDAAFTNEELAELLLDHARREPEAALRAAMPFLRNPACLETVALSLYERWHASASQQAGGPSSSATRLAREAREALPGIISRVADSDPSHLAHILGRIGVELEVLGRAHRATPRSFEAIESMEAERAVAREVLSHISPSQVQEMFEHLRAQLEVPLGGRTRSELDACDQGRKVALALLEEAVDEEEVTLARSWEGDEPAAVVSAARYLVARMGRGLEEARRDRANMQTLLADEDAAFEDQKTILAEALEVRPEISFEAHDIHPFLISPLDGVRPYGFEVLAPRVEKPALPHPSQPSEASERRPRPGEHALSSSSRSRPGR